MMQIHNGMAKLPTGEWVPTTQAGDHRAKAAWLEQQAAKGAPVLQPDGKQSPAPKHEATTRPAPQRVVQKAPVSREEYLFGVRTERPLGPAGVLHGVGALPTQPASYLQDRAEELVSRAGVQHYLFGTRTLDTISAALNLDRQAQKDYSPRQQQAWDAVVAAERSGDHAGLVAALRRFTALLAGRPVDAPDHQPGQLAPNSGAEPIYSYDRDRGYSRTQL